MTATSVDLADPSTLTAPAALVADVFHGWGISAEWMRKSGTIGPGLSSCPYLPNAVAMLWRVVKHLDVIEALEALGEDE